METDSVDPHLDKFSGNKNLMPCLSGSLTVRDGKPLAASPSYDPRFGQAVSLAINRAGCVRVGVRRPSVARGW